MKKTAIGLIVITCVIISAPLKCANSGRVLDNRKRGPYSFYSLFTTSLVKSYQHIVSPAKTGHCPMYPSCSNYGYTAFGKHNPVWALILTSDRLIRCGHDLQSYPQQEIDGYKRYFDPINEKVNARDLKYVHRPPSEPESLDDANNGSMPDIDKTSTAEDGPHSATEIFDFAEHLKADGDFTNAIIEYKRLLHYYPLCRQKVDAVLSIVYCYYEMAEYKNALGFAEKYTYARSHDGIRPRLHYWSGLCYFRLSDFNNAGLHFSLSSEKLTGKMRDKSLMMKGLAAANRWDWDKAVKDFGEVDTASPYRPFSLNCIELCRRGQSIEKKSPTLAGILSIVPGLGYFYCGYKKTALSAFIVNSLFILGTYEAFDEDLDATGALLAVMSFGWYTGNIYGAVRSAHRREFDEKADILIKMDVGFSF